MTALSLITVLVLLGVIGILCADFLRSEGIGVTSSDHRKRLGLVLVVTGLFFLRPHENTFQSLDAASYRLMATALDAGRPLHSESRLMAEIPPASRGIFRYRPTWIRGTWDTVYEISDKETAWTQPFYYPTLPLAMHGFDLLIPGKAASYFVPVLGMLLFGTLLLFLQARSGWLGLIAGIALLIATPFPGWFFRGFFPEAVATALLFPVLLRWLTRSQNPKGLDFAACGLAMVLHPVMALWAVPLIGLLAMTSTTSLKNLLGQLGIFILALMPLPGLTLWVAQPYGGLDLQTLQKNLTTSIAMGFIAKGTAIGGIALLLLLLVRNRIAKPVQAFHNRYPRWIGVLLGTGLLGWFGYMLYDGPQHRVVVNGMRQALQGLQPPFLVVVGLVLAGICLTRQPGRMRLWLGVWTLTLPAYLYLKGWDDVGMWSQRRLLPHMILLLLPMALCLSPLLVPGRRGWGVLAGLVAVALYNPLRWPAPYLLRFEQGAESLVNEISRNLDPRWVLFDYYPYSVPFTVPNLHASGGVGAYADQDEKEAFLDHLIHLQPGGVQWLTAYDNPGIETGMRLVQRQKWTRQLPRIHSTAALPATSADKFIELTLLEGQPLQANERPVLDRIFNGGFLGMRGKWGSNRHRITEKDQHLPVIWTREGSGVVGPIPEPGETLRIELYGLLGREVPPEHQYILIQPPWGGDPFRIPMHAEYGHHVLETVRPEGETLASTGLYRFHAPSPWDPASDGIRGYDSDLGMMLHRIIIQRVDL